MWAGEIPLQLQPLAPVTDPRVDPTVPVPCYVRRYRRPGLAVQGQQAPGAPRRPISIRATPAAGADSRALALQDRSDWTGGLGWPGPNRLVLERDGCAVYPRTG